MNQNEEIRQQFYKYFAKRHFTECGNLKLVVRNKEPEPLDILDEIRIEYRYECIRNDTKVINQKK